MNFENNEKIKSSRCCSAASRAAAAAGAGAAAAAAAVPLAATAATAATAAVRQLQPARDLPAANNELHARARRNVPTHGTTRPRRAIRGREQRSPEPAGLGDMPDRATRTTENREIGILDVQGKEQEQGTGNKDQDQDGRRMPWKVGKKWKRGGKPTSKPSAQYMARDNMAV